MRKNTTTSSSHKVLLAPGSDDNIVDVQENLVDVSFGFVLDAGSLLTKVVYRSREDYYHGKPVKSGSSNQLRLIYFEAGKEKQMIQFLKKNCDLRDDLKVPYPIIMTGLRLSTIKSLIEENLNIKISVIQDWKAMETSFQNASKIKIKIRKPGEAIYHHGKVALEIVVSESVWENKQRRLLGKESDGHKLNLIHGPAYQLFIANRPREWMDNFMNHPGPPQGPALIISLGSNTIFGLMDDKCNASPIDYLEVGGHTLCALAKKMLGVKDFEKLMEMASKGIAANVNLHIGDIREGDSDFDDYFSSIPLALCKVSLGNLYSSSQSLKKKYSKFDLAAGLVDMIATVVSKVAFLHARVHQVLTVYVTGSVANFEVVKRALENHFMSNSIKSSIAGGPFIRIFFLKNPGYIIALGLWQQNTKLKELSTNVLQDS